MKSRNIISTSINTLLFILIFYFCSLPVLSVILYGVNGDGKTIEAEDIFRVIRLLKDSVFLAVLVACVAVTMGLIATFALYRVQFRGRGLMRILMLLPLVSPAFVGSISFLMLFGKRGLITHDLLGLSVSPFGWHGIFLLQVLGATTTAYLILSAAVRNVDLSLEEAARNLGCSEWQILYKVTLPMMIPEITAAFLMIFLSVMADFTTPMIVGGKFRTLATDLYIQITGLYDMRLASISGIFLLIPCGIAFFLQKKFTKKRSYTGDQSSSLNIEYVHVHPLVKFTLIFITLLILSYFIINILFIFIGALTENWGYDYSFTLRHVILAFSTDLTKYFKPFINSVVLSVVTGLSSSLTGVILAYLIQRNKIRSGKYLDLIAMFPAAVPGILFGIGYLVTFKYPFFGIGKYIFTNFEPLILLGSSLIVYLICIARNINISMKSCYALLEHIDPELENAAFNLGASRFQTYRYVIIPLLKDAFANSYIKVFSGTMTSLGAIIFLLMPKNKVIVQVLFQSLTGGMSLGVPAVLALTLSMLTLVLMLFFQVLIYGRESFEKIRRKNK